jgi:hypothetical protein
MIVLTIALLAWTSSSRASIVGVSYNGDDPGVLSSAASWDGSSQLTVTGSQTGLPATTSGAFTTDNDVDPTVSMYNFLNNDTSMVWTGYEILLTANKPVTLLSPSAIAPAGWSVGVYQIPGDGTQWEVDAYDTTGTELIAPGGELDFSFLMTFTGSLTYTQTLSPMGTVAVPEPGTLVLALGGLLGLVAVRVSRRRR